MPLSQNDDFCARAKCEQYVKFKRKLPRYQTHLGGGCNKGNDGNSSNGGDRGVSPMFVDSSAQNEGATKRQHCNNYYYCNGDIGRKRDNIVFDRRPYVSNDDDIIRTDAAATMVVENEFCDSGTSFRSTLTDSLGFIKNFIVNRCVCACADLSLIVCLVTIMCLHCLRCVKSNNRWLLYAVFSVSVVAAYPNDKINLEDSIAAVFNKVAYGSTTKRSIPDNAYPLTTLATPLLTTYRYSDGNDEWLRVDVKKPSPPVQNVDFERPTDENNNGAGRNYGEDLERDHTLPTTAPAADILKNNNNRHYNNPNRYNNDRLRPEFQQPPNNRHEQVTENVLKTTTNYNAFRNVRPTKSIYSKDIPIYVPPNRDMLTPSLPKDYFNSFADKPTLRGTNSDGFANRRPIPPPSLMPNKDRIPYRPDLPPSKAVNSERNPERQDGNSRNLTYDTAQSEAKGERKKTLNTPSHNVNLDRFGEVYGRNNDTPFEYEKGYVHSITRILSGSNGRHEDISDILLKTVTATPNVQKSEPKSTKPRTPIVDTTSTKMQDEKKDEGYDESSQKYEENEADDKKVREETNTKRNEEPKTSEKSESVTIRRDHSEKTRKDVTTLPPTELLNLPNVKEKEKNLTIANSDEIWLICWNVHVYLVVVCYILLAAFSIYKLVRYENDPHMFSKSYFLTIHLMLTVICVLRIFYLTYDPYNRGNSFTIIFIYDFLHNFPLSLLATTFAVLILFLLKRTLNHLKLKTKPMFLVVFGVLHIGLCFCVSVTETLGRFDKGGIIVCKPVFVLLTWALGFSYLYLYKIIKNVLAKKTQNLSEICTQNISYASHITIAIALLFVLLGFVQLYALFFIKIDRFTDDNKHHWMLWGFELSVRVLEISIITLLAIVVSLRMSQREKQTVGFPLFPCTTSDSSNDNIFPNNCNTNPNALNYSRNEMILDNIPTEPVERPNLLKSAFQNDSFDKKSTLERYQMSDSERGSNFDRFERPKWGSDRIHQSSDQNSLNNVQPNSGHFERGLTNSSRTDRSSSRKTYDSAKYYTKPKYDLEYNNEDYQHDYGSNHHQDHNVYSEPIDNNQYERTRHEFERNDFDRRSRNSSNTSGRRSTGRTKKNHARPHLGVQTLPSHQIPDSMLVDDQGFVRFRHLQDMEQQQQSTPVEKSKKIKKQGNDLNHYSDA
ncbi:uncharacterized protein LOC108744964 [Agrilus planipennis]|uniref:Uncharacterized protein LOC108744964 n=1 Tax=Agrilus planipennis TaxID=224129 RepID=A0A7F5RNC4_AGRPL|nr:uncharacterized protein LOC108744964 [Agrilus planipennis]